MLLGEAHWQCSFIHFFFFFSFIHLIVGRLPRAYRCPTRCRALGRGRQDSDSANDFWCVLCHPPRSETPDFHYCTLLEREVAKLSHAPKLRLLGVFRIFKEDLRTAVFEEETSSEQPGSPLWMTFLGDPWGICTVSPRLSIIPARPEEEREHNTPGFRTCRPVPQARAVVTQLRSRV